MHYTSRETYEFIAQQTNDPIVERKTCKVSGQPFPVTQKDLEFYEKVSPVFNGVKYSIPAPTLCPEERQKRRLAFRQERKLYKRNSDLSGKEVITVYSPDKDYIVYSPEERWGDGRDPLDYGKEYDFERTFIEQFNELYHHMPVISLWQKSGENAAYNNNSYQLKNSYMSINSDFWELVLYGYVNEYTSNSVDCSYTYHSEHCYECFDTRSGYNCFFCNSIENCSNCYFSSDLIGCNFCRGSHGLRNTSYVWEGKHLEKAEWLARFEEHNRSQQMQPSFQKYVAMLQQTPQRNMHLSNTENCVGDYLFGSKDLQFCYDAGESHNCKFMTYAAFGCKDVYDCNALGDVELCYESNEGGVGIRNCCFIKHPMDGLYKSFYCVMCVDNSANLFGCIGLRGKEYCILNKQYTKEAYEALVPKIIQQMKKDWIWGEFFPVAMSPFGYNETLANDYFPLTKEEALEQGFVWSDYEAPLPQAERMVEGSELSDDISTVSDEILNEAIICEVTGRPFLLVKPELEFYRKHNLPLPRKHPDVRYAERMALRNPRTLHKRGCSVCGSEMVAVFPAGDSRKVLCDVCYQKEIYG